MVCVQVAVSDGVMVSELPVKSRSSAVEKY
jgi:hypothetical protein